MLRERFEPYKLRVGYLAGSGPELTLRVIVDQGTTLRESAHVLSNIKISINNR